MDTQEDLIQAYDEATAEILAGLDVAHVAMVKLRKVKQQIGVQVSELGMIDAAGRDGPGKNLSKVVEASVVIPVENVATIHGHIETARTLLIGASPDVAKLQEIGLIVEDWKTEWAQIEAVRS